MLSLEQSLDYTTSSAPSGSVIWQLLFLIIIIKKIYRLNIKFQLKTNFTSGQKWRQQSSLNIQRVTDTEDTGEEDATQKHYHHGNIENLLGD